MRRKLIQNVVLVAGIALVSIVTSKASACHPVPARTVAPRPTVVHKPGVTHRTCRPPLTPVVTLHTSNPPRVTPSNPGTTTNSAPLKSLEPKRSGGNGDNKDAVAPTNDDGGGAAGGNGGDSDGGNSGAE
jgi:hypothetical protein